MANTYVNLNTPYDAQLESIKRQQKYAELLAQQGASEIDAGSVGGVPTPISPFQGLAKVFQQGMGGYLAGQATKDQAALEASDNAALLTALKNRSTTPDTDTEASHQRSPSELATYDLTQAGSSTMSKPNRDVFLKSYTADQADVDTLRKFAPLIAGLPEDQRATISRLADVDPASALDVLKDVFKNQFKPIPSMTPAEIANLRVRIKDIALRQGTDAAKAAFEGMGGIPGIDPDAFLREILGGSAPAASSNPTTVGGVPGAVPNPAVGGTAPAGMPNRQAPAQPKAVQPTKPQEKGDLPWSDPNSSHWAGLPPKSRIDGVAKLRENQLQEQNSAVSQLSTVDRLINSIDDLSKNPGLDKISGPIAQYTWLATKEGSAARNTFNALASQAAIQQINELRAASKSGGAVGNVTEAEWGKLAEAAGMLGRATSADDVRRNLNNYKQILLGVKNKINSTYATVYGGKLNYTPDKYEGYSSANNPGVDHANPLLKGEH